MPDIAVHEIVDAVYDILRADNKTKGVFWHKGVQTLRGLPQLPAGGVSITAAGDGFAPTAPSGLQVEVPILIRVRTQHAEGVAKAEQSVQEIIGKIIDVLWGTRNLGVNRVVNVRFSFTDMEGNPEAPIPSAEFGLIWSATVRMV